jgi:hypothetical protein
MFKTIMIRVKDDPVSEAYANYCKKSWVGINVKLYDAITPATLKSQSGLKFSKRSNGRDLTDTEKACFYSQYNLWKKSATENIPILILEHDAYLEKAGPIEYNPHLDVQFFGQHAMEAVMFHPRFSNRLINYCANREVSGPMTLVDNLLGYFNKGTQSRTGRPHARYMGLDAPVRSVIDPAIGTTVAHDGTTADRLSYDRDLFKIVSLNIKSNIQ